MRTIGGVQIPNYIAMAFDPVLIVCNDASIKCMEVTITNAGGDEVTVAHDAFDGACYMDVSDYVQGLWGDVSMPDDYTAMTASEMAKRMTYTVRVLSSSWATAVDGAVSYFIWGARAYGETLGCNRCYNRASGMPFMVDCLKMGTQKFIFNDGHQTIQVTASAEGLYHVPIPSQMEDAEYITVADSMGTASIKLHDCNKGVLLRWIDRHGMLSHRVFYRGTEETETALSGEFKRNNLLNWDDDYGWQGSAGDGYTHERTESINIGAISLEQSEFKALLDLPSSPMVEMYIEDDDRWLPVRIDKGKWTMKNMPLQDMEFVVLIDDYTIQRR